MSAQRYTSKAMPAFKLMAAENEYHRRNEMLTKEIRKLRGEVGVMARRYLQARKEINQLIAKVKSQPPPIIPARIEKKEENEEGEAEEEEDVEMEGMEAKEREKEEPIRTEHVPTPRKPTSPSPIPPPPPPPLLKDTIKLEKAWEHAVEQGEKATTVNQLNTVACATDKTPPAAPVETIKTETEEATEVVMSRYEVWERAVKGYLEGSGKYWGSYEDYVSENGPGYLSNDIGQWSIENDKKVVTKFDRWGWMCVINSEGAPKWRGRLWLEQVQKARKGGVVNKIFKK